MMNWVQGCPPVGSKTNTVNKALYEEEMPSFPSLSAPPDSRHLPARSVVSSGETGEQH